MIFFFIRFALFVDRRDTVDFRSSSLYLSFYLYFYLSRYFSLSLEICLYYSLAFTSASLLASASLLSSESRSWLVLFPRTLILFLVIIYSVILGTTSFVLYYP